MEEEIRTKQELFMSKLKLLGGEANTQQMMEAMNCNALNICSIACHLKDRRFIKIVHTTIKPGKFTPPFHQNKYIINKDNIRTKRWQ